MKKKIFIILVAILVIGGGWYLTPKTFAKGVNPENIDHFSVFDGQTGTGFDISDPEDISYIVENLQSKKMKKDGISLGHMGYAFTIEGVDSNDKTVMRQIIINGENTIRKDPFFYRCDGGLCFDFLREMEEKYKVAQLDPDCFSAMGYSQNEDGTWQRDGHTYKYRLIISGRMPNAESDSTFVYLSNLKEISFEQAYMAAGFSSDTADYFDKDDAVLVSVEHE